MSMSTKKSVLKGTIIVAELTENSIVLAPDTRVTMGSLARAPVTYGILEAEYRENLSLPEVLSIVVRSAKSALKRNVRSGDSFDVSKDEPIGYREPTAVEKRSFSKNN